MTNRIGVIRLSPEKSSFRIPGFKTKFDGDIMRPENQQASRKWLIGVVMKIDSGPGVYLFEMTVEGRGHTRRLERNEVLGWLLKITMTMNEIMARAGGGGGGLF